MRKRTLGKRIQAFVLAMVMVASTFFAYAPEVEAAKGDRLSGTQATGISGNIDTSDTISLPIKIYDYENDGMLFEYSQAKPGTDVNGNQIYTTQTSTESYIRGEEAPDVYYGLDFTRNAAYSTTTYSRWGNYNMTLEKKNAVDGVSPRYLRLGNSNNTTPDTMYLTEFDEDGGSVSKKNVKYVVLVYRTDNIPEGRKFGCWIEGSGTAACWGYTASTYKHMRDFVISEDEWTYYVYNLDNLLEADTDYNKISTIDEVGIVLPGLKSTEYIDISHVAYFSTADAAEEFGEQAVAFNKNPGYYTRKTWNQGNNTAFSFLFGSQSGIYSSNTYNRSSIEDSGAEGVVYVNAYNFDEGDIDLSTYADELGYTLYTTLVDSYAARGLMTMGLVEPKLEEVKNEEGEVIEKRLVYREETVDYLAKLLSYTLKIPEKSNGNYNYNYVMGSEHSRYGTDKDLATVLREKITNTSATDSVKLGTYENTLEKKESLIGTWDECNGNITTYFDAAYFLLNNIYIPGSYNDPQDDYEYLVLSKATTTEGKETYIFDGGFTDSTDPETAKSAVKYDETQNTISNTTAIDKSLYEYETGKETTLFPFLPVTDKNDAEKQTYSPYYLDDGVLSTSEWGGTYKNRNYNYVLQSSGEFVYYADDELFFEFEGDDDVYLFINDQLVMDIGATHSITGQKMKLNDYVTAAQEAVANGTATEREKKLNLQDGATYSFDFYYMERHGYGANMRISTNIRVTDPAMETQKTAYQEGNQLAYGDSIDKEEVVEYGFAIKNVGNNRLYNLSFKDDDIGVTIDYKNGLTIKDGYKDVRVFDANGDSLDASDLRATVKGTDANGNDVEKEVSFANNDELIAFLEDLTHTDVAESGGGLWQGSTIEIRGFAYLLTDEQCSNGVFDNIVHTSAWDSKSVGSGEYLIGQATMRVFVLADPMYYQWVNHEIIISKTDFIGDILAASQTESNILAGKVNNLTKDNVNKIEECTQKGLVTNYSQVTIDENNNLTVNYTSTGSRVFYVKVTYNNSASSVIVPVLVNVTDVKDSVYVLDYGLSVDLTEGNEFFRNDTVTVPARGTKAELMAISDETPSYSTNKINFTPKNGTEDNPLGEYGDYHFEAVEKHLEQVTELKSNIPYAIISYSNNMALTDVDGQECKKNTSLTGIKLDPDYEENLDSLTAWYWDEGNLIANSPDNTNGYLNLTPTVASLGAKSTTDTANNIYLNKIYRKDAFTIQNSNYGNTTNLNQYGGTASDTVATIYASTGDGGGGGGSSWYFKEIVPASVKLTYTPGGTTGKFMEGFDTIWAAVSVQDAEYSEDPVLGTVDINNEVQMYKKVTTLPANVVYYEDDFPAIKYYEADGETVTNAFTTGSSSDKKQSADQKQEYGQDEIYQTGNTAESGGSLTKIPITKTGNIAYFEFVGTGFELIGRTNAKDSGTIGVIVTNSKEEKVFSYPVVTEFDNGGNGGDEEIYQVPIIRADNLPKDTYKVTIKGLKSPSNKNSTYLYVDGIRIFQPLGATNENYNANEDGASFTEIRDLILNGNVAVASYDGSTMKVSTGTTTWTENRNDEFEGNVVDSANEYLIYGPNNEVYMQGTHTTSALVFYVKETTDTATHNLQLAVRGVDEGLFVGSNSTGVKAETQFGYKEENGLAWYPLVTNTSSTEQYYTIDYRKCPYDESKQAYQVVVQVADGMASYSSLKMNGLELVSINGEAATLCYVNGVLTEKGNGVAVASEEYPSFDSIQIQMKATKVYAGKLPADTSGNESEDSGNTGDTDNTGDSGNTGDAGNAGDSGSAGNAGNTGDVDDTDNAGDSDNTVDTDNTENSDDADNADDSDKVVKDDTKADDDKETTKAEEGIKTGDQSNILMPVIVMITALGVIAVVIARRKMNR